MQQAATEYVRAIINQHCDDTLIFTDGSVHRSNPIRAGSAFVACQQNQQTHFASLRINTSSIAIAELCGIAHGLLWLYHKKPIVSKHIHFFADNQYAINACQSLCKTHPSHSLLIGQIQNLLSLLARDYVFQFHWIPGHTDNAYHSYTDKLANKAALSHRQPVDYDQHISMFTDGSASGWEWPSP